VKSSIEAIEESLRHDHANAVAKLLSDMERGVQELMQEQSPPVNCSHSVGLQIADQVDRADEANVENSNGLLQDQNLNILPHPEELEDSCRRRASSEAALSSSSADPDHDTDSETEDGVDIVGAGVALLEDDLPALVADQGSLLPQIPEIHLEEDNQSSAQCIPPEPADLPNRPCSTSDKERGPFSSSFSPSPPQDGAATPELILLPPSENLIELGLDPESLGIADIPPASASTFHSSQSTTQSTTSTRTTKASQATYSDASSSSLQPGGKSTFREVENVQVHGGSFVAASTVVNNNYYVTHFHGTPTPPPRSANRGDARPYSIHL
jgi:hypothetical protein